MKNMKKYIAEFIGTFVLVLFACGVAGLSGCDGSRFDMAYVGTALTFGLVIVAMAYSVGNVSGCHINPAVSIAMLASRRIGVRDFAGYVAAQFLGGFAGAAVLYALNVKGDGTMPGCNALYNGNAALSIVIEVILTFVFVLTVLGATSRKEHAGTAGLVIGGSLTLVHLLGIRFTGTSVNPARSFGPAMMSLIAGDASAAGCIWVFILAPLAGGILAAMVYPMIDRKQE